MCSSALAAGRSLLALLWGERPLLALLRSKFRAVGNAVSVLIAVEAAPCERAAPTAPLASALALPFASSSAPAGSPAGLTLASAAFEASDKRVRRLDLSLIWLFPFPIHSVQVTYIHGHPDIVVGQAGQCPMLALVNTASHKLEAEGIGRKLWPVVHDGL